MGSLYRTGRSFRIAECALDHLLISMGPLLEDPAVTEILINRENDIWCETGGALKAAGIALPAKALLAAVRLFSTLSETMTLDKAGTLEGDWRGWRVTIVVPPVARDGIALALRRHSERIFAIEEWPLREADPIVASGGSNATLRELVRTRKNILIAGPTGAGKTSLLAALMAQIPSTDRVLTLEDTPELPMACAHQVRLIARKHNSLQSLVRLSLRLRPDRLILGEVRGAEAFDLLQAMATGHAGCMGTIHAGHALGALTRLESLILMANLNWSLESIRRQIIQRIDAVVHVMRDARGRFIQELVMLDGLKDGEYQLRPLVTQ